MTRQAFYTYLLGLSAFVALALVGLMQLLRFSSHGLLYWGALLFFVLFSLTIFYFGKKAASSSNKLTFSRLFMAATVAKMFLSLLLILLYFYSVQPAEKSFILPFFFVYLCFTIFEVYFMTKLGQT